VFVNSTQFLAVVVAYRKAQSICLCVQCGRCRVKVMSSRCVMNGRHRSAASRVISTVLLVHCSSLLVANSSSCGHSRPPILTSLRMPVFVFILRWILRHVHFSLTHPCLVAMSYSHGRLHIGANGVSWPPPGKIGWKIITCKKEHFSLLQSALFCSQIFKSFFASSGKGALTPLTKILQTFLVMARSTHHL